MHPERKIFVFYCLHPNLINEISTDAYLSKLIRKGTDGLRESVEIINIPPITLPTPSATIRPNE